jgi:regulator of sirC expression with transglutaminase-like and TPR domain
MWHIAGIPITLSLLFMEVAANVGLPMKVGCHTARSSLLD